MTDTTAPIAPDPFAFQAEELAQAEASALSQAELDELTDKLIEAFKSVYDPEIPVDIFELGLIYRVDVSDDRDPSPARCRAGSRTRRRRWRAFAPPPSTSCSNPRGISPR